MSFDEEYKHLAELNTQIKEAEDALKELKNVVTKALQNKLQNIKLGDAGKYLTKEHFSSMYWANPSLYTQIARTYKGIFHSTFEPLPQGTVAPCTRCGNEIFHECKSNSIRKSFTSSRDRLCDYCLFEDKFRQCVKHAQKSILRKQESKNKPAAPLSKNTSVEALRTMPYSEYLKTDHWKRIRNSALYRANYTCQLCRSKEQLHVHHNTYVRRGCESNGDVIVLCHVCHGKFHDKLPAEDREGSGGMNAVVHPTTLFEICWSG